METAASVPSPLVCSPRPCLWVGIEAFTGHFPLCRWDSPPLWALAIFGLTGRLWPETCRDQSGASSGIPEAPWPSRVSGTTGTMLALVDTL